MTENRIAVSKLSTNYENWLKKIDNTLVIIDLYKMEPDEASAAVRNSSGLLLTGGGDIHPTRYGKDDYLQYCREIDEKRDELELLLIQLAFEDQMPVLGICRGLQILNVAFRGTLVPDIPQFSKSTVPHSGNGDVYHRVTLKESSRLYDMTGVSNEIVNSSHHQGIEALAKGFTASAHGPDFIIEAIEANQSVHPFCVAVQWHPERMDFGNPLSWKLGVKFLEEAKENRK